MDNTELYIDTIDYKKRRVIFHEKNRAKHANRKNRPHSILADPKYLKKIEEAIKNPDEVYSSRVGSRILKQKDDRVFYKLLYYQNTRWGRFNVYLRIIIRDFKEISVVKTAHLDSNQYIREEGQAKCLYKKRKN